MLNLQFFALNASKEVLSMPERLSEAGSVTLMGMGAIFFVLALLWACIEVMHLFLGEKEAKKEKKPTPKEEKNESAPVTVSAPTVAPASAQEDDGAIVAAITAAISAAMAEEGYTGGFRVVSFKRVSANNRRNRV